MKIIDIDAYPRNKSGKGISRSLRRNGRLPAVIYGGGCEPLVVALDTKAFQKTITSTGGEHAILSVKIEETTAEQSAAILALVKDVQHNTITRQPVHVDLLRVSMDKEVDVPVSIKILNDDNIKKQGLIIQHLLNEITVKCLPDKIPEVIELDISGFKAGDAVHLKDIPKIDDVKFVEEEDSVILTLLTPTAATEEKEKTTAEAAPEESAQTQETKTDDKDKKKGK